MKNINLQYAFQLFQIRERERHQERGSLRVIGAVLVELTEAGES